MPGIAEFCVGGRYVTDSGALGKNNVVTELEGNPLDSGFYVSIHEHVQLAVESHMVKLDSGYVRGLSNKHNQAYIHSWECCVITCLES